MPSQISPSHPSASTPKPSFSIRHARFPEDRPHAAALYNSYLAWMPAIYREQYCESLLQEVDELPGKYDAQYGGEMWFALMSKREFQALQGKPLAEKGVSGVNDDGQEDGGEEEDESDAEEEVAVGMVSLKALSNKQSKGQTLPLDEALELEDAVQVALESITTSNIHADNGSNGTNGKHIDKRKICEPKRLFAFDETRGMGIGKALMEACIEEAKTKGYVEMVLETASVAVGALKLYTKLGFQLSETYTSEVVGEFIYLTLDLTK